MTDDFDARRALALAVRERTRRHFFADCGVGLGAMALASLFEGERPARAMSEGDLSPSRSAAAEPAVRARREPARGPSRAFPRAGQERDLSLHGRRTEPARALRLQAPASEV